MGSYNAGTGRGPNILTERGFTLIRQETLLLRHILFTRNTTQPFPKMQEDQARLQDLSNAATASLFPPLQIPFIRKEEEFEKRGRERQREKNKKR